VSDRLRELLLQAVRTLKPEEQEEVLAELLVAGTATSLSGPPTPAEHPVSLPPYVSITGLRRRFGPVARTEDFLTTLAVTSGDVKVLPVRLPEADYERLRAWSKEHGFSMAVIIRTLVERFLDEQGAPRPEPADPAAPAGPADPAAAAE
jgi:hypothetical protein